MKSASKEFDGKSAAELNGSLPHKLHESNASSKDMHANNEQTFGTQYIVQTKKPRSFPLFVASLTKFCRNTVGAVCKNSSKSIKAFPTNRMSLNIQI